MKSKTRLECCRLASLLPPAMAPESPLRNPRVDENFAWKSLPRPHPRDHDLTGLWQNSCWSWYGLLRLERKWSPIMSTYQSRIIKSLPGDSLPWLISSTDDAFLEAGNFWVIKTNKTTTTTTTTPHPVKENNGWRKSSLTNPRTCRN